jgi:RNA polymerase sigma-54 factor
VVPEVVVEKIDGRWTVQVKSDYLPHLRISNLYRKLMQEQGEKPEVVRYIRDKVQSGKMLIKALQERQSTIHRIAREIVRQQQDFLEYGFQGLKGMTMADVAERVGVHETTVSRTVNGKYMQTPRGIFEMRFFFNAGYDTGGEHSLANRAVKEAIADMVSKENKAKPLSDQEISARLKDMGIPIARRTIAKYRDELKILPSNLRRDVS